MAKRKRATTRRASPDPAAAARKRNATARELAQSRPDEARGAILALPARFAALVAVRMVADGDLAPVPLPEPADDVPFERAIVWTLEHQDRERLIDAAGRTAVGGDLSALTLAIEGRPRDVQPFRPVSRASLPRLERADSAAIRTLPAFADDGPSDAPFLPGFSPAVGGCPSWLLSAFDAGGGRSMAQGRGAPWTLRLWIAALCSVPVRERTGAPALLALSVRDVASWLHPDGWTNRRRDWAKLPAALDQLGALRVPVGEHLVALVHAPVVPRRWDPDGRIVLQVRIPAAAAAGVRLDWGRLHRYGADSAVMYRGYLAVSALLDRAAHRGAPVTRRIAAAVVGADGQPRRRRGGAIVRTPAALDVHPFAGMAPRIETDGDAARLLGFNATSRERRRDARRALERLDADGVIDLHRLPRGGFKIYGPRR